MQEFKERDFVLNIIQDKYSYGGNPYFALVIKECLDGEEEYVPGEPWADISINLPGLKENEIALNHDFSRFSSKKLIEDVIRYLTDDPIPVRYIQQGFVNFPIYEVKKELR